MADARVREAETAGVPGIDEAYPTFAVSLAPRAYWLAWTGIYVFHAICAGYYFAAGIFFYWCRNLAVVAFFKANKTVLDPQYYPLIAVIHFILGGIHVNCIMVPLITRLQRHQRCQFLRPQCRPYRPKCSSSSIAPHSFDSGFLKRMVAMAQKLIKCVFGRQGLFGIESRQFDSLTFVREAFETLVQSYQAYQMSRLLARRMLIRLYVATLVANCWITPILHHTIRSQPLQRMLDRAMDVALDFLSSVGVPLALVASYAKHFDLVDEDFSVSLYTDRVWSITARNESSIVFFSSWPDAVGRLVFSIGLLLLIDDMESLLHLRSVRASVHPQVTVVKPTHLLPQRKHGSLLNIGHRLLFIYGVALLAVHSHSESISPPASCLLVLRPWLATEASCEIVEFNCCKHPHLTGSASQFVATFGKLYPPLLNHVSFRHCHQVEILPAIQLFHSLSTLAFYNSTILLWGGDAAVTGVLHPNLVSVIFVRTKFANESLPDGLLSIDFPQTVNEVTLSLTNLATIPRDLDLRWRQQLSLIIEMSQLSEFPEAFTRMRLINLILVSNNIHRVPTEAFQVPGMFLLGLSGNPISHLPDDVQVDNTNELIAILLYETNLTSVPDWVLTLVSQRCYIEAGRTPYCDAQLMIRTNHINEGHQVPSVQ